MYRDKILKIRKTSRKKSNQIQKLRERKRELLLKIKKLKEESSKLKLNKFTIPVSFFLYSIYLVADYLSFYSQSSWPSYFKEFVLSILNEKRNLKYPEEVKQFLYTLYKISPPAYNFLKKNFPNVLPDPQTLHLFAKKKQESVQDESSEGEFVNEETEDYSQIEYLEEDYEIL